MAPRADLLSRLLKRFFHFSCAVVLLGLPLSCSEREEIPYVSLEKREAQAPQSRDGDGEKLRIAVGGMITPREGFAYYRELLDYIGERVGRRVVFVDRENYREINALLESGNIDVAFVCGGPYVDGREKFGLQLLAAPVSYGESVYYSYIIVHRDRRIRDFEGLRGGSFAFTDPLSNSGTLVPTYMLSREGESPERFFASTVFTYAHDKSIRAVAEGLVDGAAVDSLIWEYANRKNPELTSRTRVIHRSPPFGIPPVVIRPGLDPELAESVKGALLSAHLDEEGGRILGGMMIERFVEIGDEAYDSIREMKAWLKEQGAAE